DERLFTKEVVKEMRLNIQGVRIVANLHVLTLCGQEVILGIAWMSSIGRILFDYSTMTMEFKLGRKKRRWKGLSPKDGDNDQLLFIELKSKVEFGHKDNLEDEDRFEGRGSIRDHQSRHEIGPNSTQALAREIGPNLAQVSARVNFQK